MNSLQRYVKGQFINAEEAHLTQPEVYNQWGLTFANDDWGVKCTECQQPLKYQPVAVGYRLDQHTRCPKGCPGRKIGEDVLIRHQYQHLIGDDAQLLNRDWWHSSLYEPNDFEQDFVDHVGSRDAALHRAVGYQDMHNFDRYLYRISLKPDATVDPVTWIESRWRPAVFGFRNVPAQYSLRPYINAMEAPGEVSLTLYGEAITSYEYVGKLTVDRGASGNQGIVSADFQL